MKFPFRTPSTGKTKSYAAYTPEARGYGAACWGFPGLCALPISTIGIYKIAGADKE